MPLNQSVRIFPPVVNLTDLSFDAGFKIEYLEGIPGVNYTEGAALGSSLASFYDGNNRTNLLIGAQSGDPDGLKNAGSIFAVTFGSSVWPIETKNLSSVDAITTATFNAGQADMWSGNVVTCDLDGDGFNELIIGARYGGSAGQVNVVWGQQVGYEGSYRLNDMGEMVTSINGAKSGDSTGRSLACVENAGQAYLLIGAYHADPNSLTSSGATYLLPGNTVTRANDFGLATIDGTNGVAFYGTVSGESSGYSSSFFSNVLGDGSVSVAIGAPHIANFPSNTLSSVYILFDPFRIAQSPWDLSQVAIPNGIVLQSGQADDLFGAAIADVGDVNGDGKGDFVITAPRSSVHNETDAGKAYLFFGGEWLQQLGRVNVTDLTPNQVLAIEGGKSNDLLGDTLYSVAGGDIDGNGIDDLVVCARAASPYGQDKAGTCYLIPGGSHLTQESTIDLAYLESWHGSAFIGEMPDDQLGHCVLMADLNQDGFDDIVMSARYSDPNGLELAGTVYALYGRNNSQVVDVETAARTVPPTSTTRPLPAIVKSELTLDVGDTVVLTPQMFQAQSTQVDAEGLVWIVSGVRNGQFEAVSQPGKVVNEFSQGAVNRGEEVQFSHDGSNSSPYFEAVVTDGVSRSEIQVGQIQFAGIPVLLVNQLTLDALLGQVTLTERELLADMQQLPATDILFTLSDVEHGVFIDRRSANQTTTQFTQAQVLDEGILFVGDGSYKTPSYSVQVSTVAKPDITSHPTEAQTSLCTEQGCSFRVAKNGFYIQEGGNTTLTPEHIHACSEAYWVNLGGAYTCSSESQGEAVTFFVDNPTACRFTYTDNTQLTIATFTHTELESGQIQVKHDGHEIPPSYNLWVSNNGLDSRIYPGRVVYQSVNDAPYVAQGMEAYYGSVGQPFSLYVSSDTYGDVDNSFEELTITAERVDGEPWPDGFFFDSEARRFYGEMQSPWASDIRVTATDPGGLAATVQFPFTMGAAEQQPTDNKNIFQKVAPYTPLVTIPIGLALFAWRQKKKATYRSSKQLANAIRQRLNLDMSNFSNDHGRDYVAVIDTLITIFNNNYQGFYANLGENSGKIQQLAQAVSQAIMHHNVSMPRAGWGWCAHCRGLRQIDLAEFRNRLSDIASTAVEKYNELPNVRREVEMKDRISMTQQRGATSAWLDSGTDAEVPDPLAPFTT